jgi:hypothetical protein
MEEWQVPVRLAVATALKAQELGLAQLTRSREELQKSAEASVRQARDAMRLLMKEGLIAQPPDTASMVEAPS